MSRNNVHFILVYFSKEIAKMKGITEFQVVKGRISAKGFHGGKGLTLSIFQCYCRRPFKLGLELGNK